MWNKSESMSAAIAFEKTTSENRLRSTIVTATMTFDGRLQALHRLAGVILHPQRPS